MSYPSESDQNFDLKKSNHFSNHLSIFVEEKQLQESITSHLKTHYLKNTTKVLPILYVINKQILIVQKNKENFEEFFHINPGNLVAVGAYNNLFNVNEKALKVPQLTKDAASIKKSSLSLQGEAAFLSKIHENSRCIGIQEKVTLKKVQDICYVKENCIESLRKNLPIEDQANFEITISEGIIYRGTLEDFIKSNKNSERYKKHIFEMQRDLAHGLDLIHSLNIMHGDIKHKNIFYELSQSQARAYLADFGSADMIRSDDLFEKINYPLYCSLACTRGEDIGDYNSPAQLLNSLISKKTRLNSKEKEKINILKTHCRIIRKQIDIFQLGVVFYQMTTQNTRKVPYPFIEKLGPKDIDPIKIKKDLEFFYEDEARIDCILLMLASDPRKRPSSKKIKEVFSFF